MKSINGNEIIQLFESWSPKKYACMPNDPIGLAIGTLNKPISNVLVTLDVTHEVVDEPEIATYESEPFVAWCVLFGVLVLVKTVEMALCTQA